MSVEVGIPRRGRRPLGATTVVKPRRRPAYRGWRPKARATAGAGVENFVVVTGGCVVVAMAGCGCAAAAGLVRRSWRRFDVGRRRRLAGRVEYRRAQRRRCRVLASVPS